MILFNDVITAYHKEHFEDPDDGTTEERRAQAPFIERIPCQISYESDDKGTPRTAERIPQARPLKVFVWFDGIPRGAQFRRGDYVIFERLDDGGLAVTHHEGTIGEPRVYTRGIAHVELSLEGEE